MTALHFIHAPYRRMLGGLAALGLVAAATAAVLLSTPTAATATTALPCTYSEVVDENGDYAGAVPNRDEADTVMAVHAHEASDHTPAGKIAVINAVAGLGNLVITSITATDSDGTFTVSGPAASLNFDATTHSTTLSDYPANSPYPTAYIHSVTICAAMQTTPGSYCTQPKIGNFDFTDGTTGNAADYFSVRTSSVHVAPPLIDSVNVTNGPSALHPGVTTLYGATGSYGSTEVRYDDHWEVLSITTSSFTQVAPAGFWVTGAILVGCYTPLTATPTSTPSPAATAAVSPTITAAASSTTTAAAPSATAADPTTTPGGTETASAGGFKAGEAVSAVLHSTPVKLGNFTANASGVVTVPFTVPATLETGAHTVVLSGLTSGHVATAHFTVAAAPADLASTGIMHTGGLLAGGAGAVALGVGVLALTMWRRRMTPQH